MKNIFLIFKRNFFLFLPFVFIPTLNNSNSLLSILVLSIYLLVIYFSKTEICNFKSPISKVFLSYIVYISIHSIIFTDYSFINFIGSNTRHYGIFLYVLLFFLFLFFQSFSQKRFNRVICVNLIVANILSIIGMLQLLFPDIYGYIDKIHFFDGKIFSSFLLPNFFGQYLSLSLGLGLYNKLKNSKIHKLIFVFPILALLLTRSKVAILATIAVFLLYFYKKINFKDYIQKSTLLVLPLFAMFSFQEFFHLGRSFESRIEILKSSFSLFLDNLLGLNFYGLESYFPKVINSTHYMVEQNLDVIFDKSHNFIMDFLIIGGLPSLVFLGFVCSLLMRKIQKEPIKLLLILPVLIISLFSFFSVPSLILITLIFAIIFNYKFEPVSSRAKINFILLTSIITIFFTSSFYGHLQFKKFQNTDDLSSLESTLFFNPTNLKANLEVLKFIKEDNLDEFYIKNKNTFSSQNFVIKRAFLKSKALRGDDIEVEIQSLINQNPNDFKNHLLLANYYYYKKDFTKASIAFYNLKKHLDINLIQDFQHSKKYLQAFKRFE